MIMFRKIRWKNFLSTGNIFSEIDLSAESSTLVIGSNGSGKSTFLDAICFALFGKPFRNINKPQLLNSINLKDCAVEVEFDVSGKSYKVIRGIKPNVFEIYCDNVLLSQSAANRDYQEHLEKFILKLNYKSFTQIVILGSASFTPFMQLSANDRRLIIEDLLDIQIFSRMNGILKERYAKLKDEISSTKHKLELATEKHEIQSQHLTSLVRGKKEKIQQKRELLTEEQDSVDKIEAKSQTVESEIIDLEKRTKDLSSIRAKLSKYDNVEANLTKTLTKINADIDLYRTTEECPTCKQGISHDHKETLISERERKIGDVQKAIQELNTKYNQEVDRLNEINELLVVLNGKRTELSDLAKSCAAAYKYINTLTTEIGQMEADQTDLQELQQKIADLQLEIDSCNSTHETLTNEKQYLDTATTLLKDTGIKTKIIRQYIPVINKYVNKYLSAMDFFVNFTLDESFKESIKSRHRDEFSYESFSEGEKQKIDIALLLTWRVISKMKNSSNTNLLIMDEVFDSSLDSAATEHLMNIFTLLENTNLFVISHKGDVLQDKFRNVLRFQKVNNFSRIVK